jgi:hypothetical protein
MPESLSGLEATERRQQSITVMMFQWLVASRVGRLSLPQGIDVTWTTFACMFVVQLYKGRFGHQVTEKTECAYWTKPLANDCPFVAAKGF